MTKEAAFQNFHRCLRNLKAERAMADVKITEKEHAVVSAISALIERQPGSLRQTAQQMGISAPYLSDIVNGRRHISDAAVEKLAKLK